MSTTWIFKQKWTI